jgi:uncharacterized membrane protein YfcA
VFDITPDLIPLVLALLGTGAVAGLLAGLLGVGGGIVIVPVLFTVLGSLDVPLDVRMHVAVGTSLATIIPTSIASVRGHMRKNAVDWPLFKAWLPGLVVGVLAGTWLANTQFDGRTLTLVFAGVALLVAMDLVLRNRANESTAPSGAAWYRGARGSGVAGVIGAFSAMMGIGGGTLSVPFLNAVGEPIHRAVATSAGFGLIIAVPATMGYATGGWGAPGLPAGSLGYVNLLGFAAVVCTTVLTAPLGSRLAHAASARTLRLLFAGFLILTAVRMISAS